MIISVFLLLTASLVSAGSYSKPSKQWRDLCGDVNGDRMVDSSDALIVAQQYAGFVYFYPGSSAFERADVDGNGVITMRDVLFISQYAQRLRASLFCHFTVYKQTA